MERARELIRPWIGREGVIGIYVVGSSTRPHRDALSDYDIEVVVEDAVYEALPDSERHVLVIDEGPPRRVDHEFYLWPWSDFAALVDSRRDLFHSPYRHAAVLHDPEGRIAPVVERLAELPEEVRRERLRVHFLEFLFGAGRSRKTFERRRELDGRLVAAEALVALAKLLFLAKGSWPSTRHWSEAELRLLGVPEEILTGVLEAARDPAPARMRDLADRVKAWLDEAGMTFHHDVEALTRWAYLTPEGKAAFERWSPP
jgi:hypothetical protein